MSANETTIIFDLGAVLIDWNPRYLYRKIFDDDDEVEFFLSEICPPEWNRTLDAGRPFSQAIADRVQRYPAYEEAIEAYWSRWLEMVEGPIEGSVKILKELKARRESLFALTNWSAESFPLVRNDPAYDFLDDFEHIVVSGEIMMIKPNPEIYEHMLEVIGRPADECLFIDDSKVNCDAAAAFGLQIHHFTSAEELRSDLVARRLLDQ